MCISQDTTVPGQKWRHSHHINVVKKYEKIQELLELANTFQIYMFI